ncbi:mannitol dehydrogenase family protein [Marinomonas sp. TI.3.20]|uniref:mannitol dehydrogenase family protein n=1 Tax=Marinomonas sp. TI.3.20 TaxID=3121296 RepID=UPI00311D2D12
MVSIKRINSLYSPENIEVGIVHIGLGAFHRAHQAVYIEKNLNRNMGGAWGICSVNIRSNKTLVDQLETNNCRYHIAEYTDSQHVDLREINAIREALYAGDDKEVLFERLLSSNTKIVSLTVTEKGYYLKPADKKLRLDDPSIQHDLKYPTQPKTVPGILVEALYRRREIGLAPFTILSCDNMPNNGELTRQAVCELASYRSDEFAQWIQSNVAFPSSMVDRIVPAMTDESRKRLQEDVNCDDQNTVICEAFSQWVVEDNFSLGRPDWENDGVQMVKDVHPFETMKLRLLNGSHSLLAYIGLAANYTTIAKTIEVPEFANLIRHYMVAEAAPTLNMPKDIDVSAYIESLIQRFSNDSLHHQLSQIAIDGSQKIPQRWLTSTQERLSLQQNVSVVALGVAAWILYVRGQDLVSNQHVVDDPMAEQLSECYSQSDKPDMVINNVLALKDIFPKGLMENTSFYQAVLTAYQVLIEHGVMACLTIKKDSH